MQSQIADVTRTREPTTQSAEYAAKQPNGNTQFGEKWEKKEIKITESTDTDHRRRARGCRTRGNTGVPGGRIPAFLGEGLPANNTTALKKEEGKGKRKKEKRYTKQTPDNTGIVLKRATG